MLDFIIENWAALLIGVMAFAKVVVNLTPTETANQGFGWIAQRIDALGTAQRKDT